MQRDQLLLTEIIDAGERIIALVASIESSGHTTNRDLLDALRWNFTGHDDVPALIDAVRALHREI